jgi:hypothetical protein
MSASPSASEPDPQAQAKADVLAVYATFMDARNKSLNNPRKPPDRRLFQVSIPPARDELYNLVLYYRAKGMLVSGATRSAPSLSTLEIHGETASFMDCVDGSDAIPTDRKSGESAIAPDQEPRLWVEVRGTHTDGTWFIDKWDVKRNRPC